MSNEIRFDNMLDNKNSVYMREARIVALRSAIDMKNILSPSVCSTEEKILELANKIYEWLTKKESDEKESDE